MCRLDREGFMRRTPGYVGDILYEHLQMLKQEGAAQTSGKSESKEDGNSGQAEFGYASNNGSPTYADYAAAAYHHQQQQQQQQPHPHLYAQQPFDLSSTSAASADYRLLHQHHHQSSSYLQHPVRSMYTECRQRKWILGNGTRG